MVITVEWLTAENYIPTKICRNVDGFLAIRFQLIFCARVVY